MPADLATCPLLKFGIGGARRRSKRCQVLQLAHLSEDHGSSGANPLATAFCRSLPGHLRSHSSAAGRAVGGRVTGSSGDRCSQSRSRDHDACRSGNFPTAEVRDRRRTASIQALPGSPTGSPSISVPNSKPVQRRCSKTPSVTSRSGATSTGRPCMSAIPASICSHGGPGGDLGHLFGRVRAPQTVDRQLAETKDDGSIHLLKLVT